MTMRNVAYGIAGLIACLGVGQSLNAQTLSGDTAAGYQFAMRHCAACHIVTANQDPPRAIAVPSFYEISRGRGVTEPSLRVFLQSNHNRMPNFIIGRNDQDNVVSYILSLRDLPFPKRVPPTAPDRPAEDIIDTRIRR